MQFVSIHLGIETIVLFKYTRQPAGSRVHGAPISHAFDCIDFIKHIAKLPFPEGLYGYTLLLAQYITLSTG